MWERCAALILGISEGAGVIMLLVLQDGRFGGICSPVNTNGEQYTGSGRMALGVLFCCNSVWLKYKYSHDRWIIYII